MDEKDIHEHLSAIEERLKTIEGKLSDKWFLPVFITVLTAALGVATFFIQRSASNSDINKNKEREIIGAFLGQTKVDFYKSCKDSLIMINEQFESYCKIGQEKQVFDDLVNVLINFKKFYESQKVIDQDILATVKNYAEYVTEKTFEISSNNFDQNRRVTIYNESESLYNDANDKLNKGINALQEE